MAMVKAQQEADANYNAAMEQYNAQVAAAEETLNAWTGIASLMEERNRAVREQREAEQRVRDQQAHDAAVAQLEEDKRIAAEKAAEQAEVGTEGDGGSANQQGTGDLQKEMPNDVATQTMSRDEAIAFIAAMEDRAEVAPSVDLSIENWDALFGKDGIVNTPIGEVKMGDNQFTKMMREDRHGKLGMVKPTLENPDVILEDASKAKEGDDTERPSSYIFVKAFKKADGSRYYYFTSVTVSKDGREVVVSNQEKRKNAVANLLSKDKLVWKHADDVSDASDVAQGLYSSQGNVSDLATEGTDAPQTSMSNLKEWSEDGSTSISPAEKQQPADTGNISALDTSSGSKVNDNQPTLQGKEEKSEEGSTGNAGEQRREEVARLLKNPTTGNVRKIQAIYASTGMVDDLTDPVPDTLEEYISRCIGVRQWDFDSFSRETGLKRGIGRGYDTNKINSLFAKKGEGETFNSVVHSIWQGLPEHLASFDTEDVRNTLIDMLHNYGTVFELRNVALLNRINAAESFMQAAEEREEEERERYCQEAYHMSVDEYEAYEAYLEEYDPYEGIDYDELYEELVEARLEYEKQLNVTSNGQETTANGGDQERRGDVGKTSQTASAGGKEKTGEGGDGILPSSQADKPRGIDEADGKRGETEDDNEDAGEHAPAQEGASGSGVRDGKSSENKGATPLSEQIATASADVNTEPTEAQKEAGNYKKGHVQVGTFDVTIEQPQGSVRRGTDADGKAWESKMHNTYGYFRGTEGVDGDHIDVFLSNDIDGWNGRKVYVVDQYNPDGTFDEHKVMLGFNDMDEAKSDYLANYEKGWEDGRRIVVSTTNLEDFEKWIDSSHRKTKPFSEYAGVKKETVANAPAKGDTAVPNNNKPRLQKAGAAAAPASKNERVLRDALDEHLRKSGMEVIGTDEGQRVLDAANGESKGIRLALDAINKESDKTSTADEKVSSRHTEVSSDSDAKVDNRIELPSDYKEKLSALSERIANGEKISPEDFLLAIEKALGSSNENADKSQYFKGKDDATLRLANHRGSATMFLVHDHATGNTSVVVKMSDKRGKKNSSVDLKEFVYFPDKMDANVQQSIVGGLQEWVETGEYNRPCDQIITSVMRNGVREQRMNHGSGTDAAQPRFFRTKDGEAYGFTVGGRIYYDPRIATSETLVHEYAHLWASALRGGNAEEWKNVVGLMKGTSVWDEVKRLYPELKTDDEIADEVIAQYSGRRGAERLREEARKIAEVNGGVFEKAEAISALEKIRRALAKFWKGVCDMLHIHYTSAEEVADRVTKDLLDGVDPRKFGKDNALRMQENEEIADIVAKAKADGTYMKAPNGKPSNLSPRQWAQVRTKAFKTWFGDWEKAARIEKLRESEPVEITGEEITPSDDLKEYKKNALEYGKSLRGSYTNEDTGEVIDLTGGNKRGGIREILQHDYKDSEHLQSIAAIPQIIEKSVFIDELPNEDKQHYPDVKSFRYYVCGLKIGGTDYTVKAVVAEQNNGTRYYDHRLTDIEKGKLLSIVPTIQKAGIDGTLPNSVYKDKRLFSILQTNSSKVVDENGEPRVVYHQTNSKTLVNRKTGERFDDLDWNDKSYWQTQASQEEFEDTWEGRDFYAFDNTEHGRRSIEMPAFFFSPQYDEYHEYGERTIVAFLNVKNPAINPKIENAGVYDDAGEKAMGKLIEEGHDGFIREYDGVVEEINAFYPNQIKSATENVGTFDAENNDIRFQFVGERGAEAADRAEEVTTRLDNLGVAREMEEAKKDAKAIKMATGWERGADGKWRYEIPDIEYVPTGDADLNRRVEMQPWGKEYASLTDRMIDGETLTEAEMKRFEELAAKAEEIGKLYREQDKKSLADYVRADELFKAYPKLRAVNVEFVNKNASVGGSYSEKENTIYLNNNSLVSSEEVLAHEIQHAIQHIEGFAQGGNPDNVRFVNENAKKRILQTSSEIWSGYHNTEEGKRVRQEYRELFKKRIAEARMENPSFRAEDLNTDDIEQYLEGKYPIYRNLRNKERAYEKAIGFSIADLNKQPKTAYEAYNRLSGEVESRNVQKRMGMTEAERRASLAAETEDVSREDQIFLFGEGGESHMGSRTDKRMAEIGEHYEGKTLTDEERTVVDVYSGKKDRQSIDITNNDGISIHLEMQQGNEPNAGTKHSIFRHVGKDNGSISYEEIKLIPDVVKTGKRTDKGTNVVYQKKIDGVRYTVYTDKKGKKETFHDFYSNRKTAESKSLSGKSTNTQSSARTSDNAVLAAKVARKSETASVADGKVADEDKTKFRLLEDDDPKAQEANNEAMVDRVNELAERLHTPVRIIRTDEDVASLPSARQRRMKGSFNPMTGEVTIVVPNNANMADVENTFIHEVVGHDGLRVLFPEEEKLNNALDELYRVSNEGIRQTIDRMAQKMYDAEVDRLREKKRREHEAKGEDANAHYYADMAEAHVEASKKREQFRRDATEEYGADLAGRIGEKGFEKMSAEELTFWGKLKAMLQKALARLLEGLKIPGKRKWSDKDWAFVLHEAYKRKKNGGRPTVFDAADTEVMRRKTGFGETKFSDGRKKADEPKPIGHSTFGSVYNQFKGKVLQAVKFLTNHKSGDLLGVFHRKDIGDIDMVWGDDGGGLCHILNKHINEKDFPTVKDLVSRIEDIVNNGKVDFSNGDKMVLKKDGYVVTIRRNVREKGIKIADKNWVLTAYNKDAPANTKAPADGTHGSTAVAPGTSSDAKVSTLSEINEFPDENVEDEDIRYDMRKYRNVFGGNSGYVGYSMSKRAAQAREDGRFPKTDFKKKYKMKAASFKALVDANVIDNSEWHHTSMYGNKTTFYQWGEPEYADIYAENRKEVDAMVAEQEKETNAKIAELQAELDAMPAERPYKYEMVSEEFRNAERRIQREASEKADIINYSYPYPMTEEQNAERKSSLQGVWDEREAKMRELEANASKSDKAILVHNKANDEYDAKRIDIMRTVDRLRKDATTDFYNKLYDYFDSKLAEIQAKEAEEGSTAESEAVNERFNEELDRVNDKFNGQLATLTEKNADKVVLSLGRPSAILQSAGVKNKHERAELTDYMMAKHGLERNDVMARRAAAKQADGEFVAELLILIVSFVYDGVEFYELTLPSLIISATFSPIVEGIWEPGPE